MVDYAENVGPLVAELVDTLAETGADRLVRVLLLARTDEGWFRELAVEHPLHDWVDPNPITLDPLPARWDAQHTRLVWGEAVAAFAAHARKEGLQIPRDLDAEPGRTEFATTLDLYADALLTVLQAADGSVAPVGGADALSGVLAHERLQIFAGLQADGLNLSEVEQDWAIAAVILRAAADTEEAVRVMAGVPALRAC